MALWLGVSAFAAEAETLAERTLKKIAERQREVFAEAVKQGDKFDEASMKQQLQTLVHDYELLLRNNPKYAEAYAAWLSRTTPSPVACQLIRPSDRCM